MVNEKNFFDFLKLFIFFFIVCNSPFLFAQEGQVKISLEKVDYSGSGCPISEGVKLYYPSLLDAEGNKIDLLMNGLDAVAEESKYLDSGKCILKMYFKIPPSFQMAIKASKASFRTSAVGRGHSMATFDLKLPHNQTLFHLEERVNATNQGTVLDPLNLEKIFSNEEMIWFPSCFQKNEKSEKPENELHMLEATIEVYAKVGFQGFGSIEIATLPIMTHFLEIRSRPCPE